MENRYFSKLSKIERFQSERPRKIVNSEIQYFNDNWLETYGQKNLEF